MKTHLLSFLIAAIAFPMTAPAQSCANIAGEWSFTETGTLTMTILGGGGSDRCNFTESGRIRITQNGCSITYSAVDLDSTGCDILGGNPQRRFGTISGTRLTLDGTTYFPVPGQVDVIEESTSASGSVSGNRITLNGTGRVVADLPINDGVRFTWTSRVTLDRILDCPNMTLQPTNRTVFAGATVSFVAAATHRETLRYQWRKNGANIPGANGPALTLRQVTSAQAGNYTLVVSNSQCGVTSQAARLTVNALSAPGAVWQEGWESSPLGKTVPTDDPPSFIPGDKGNWFLGDTVSSFPECGPTQNRGCIQVENGRKALWLVAATNIEDCADNIFIGLGADPRAPLSIPLLPTTQVSFFEQGFMSAPEWNGFFSCFDPPCGDTVNLKLEDDRGNLVVYVFQRAPNYVPHAQTNGPSVRGYLEVFLDPAGGIFSRDLYEDFAAIAGLGGVGGSIRSIGFELASTGWAVLDDLRIGRTVAPTLVAPAIINQPANVTTNALAAKVTLKVGATGSAPLSYQWQKNGTNLVNGGRVSGATSAAFMLTTLRTNDSGAYSVTVSNSAGTAASQLATLTVLDTTRPTVAIQSPAANARVFDAMLDVRGQAADNEGVAAVLVKVGNGSFQLAAGTTNWTARMELAPGTNRVCVKSVDAASNESAVVTNRYIYVVSGPLMLTVEPGGKVTGATDGQLLEVGRIYTLTAMPSNGFRFAGWSGDIISTNLALTFQMPSNLTVQANFADALRPTVSIALPANNTRISNAVAMVRGTASDNLGVNAVLWQLNGEPFEPAAGTTSWVATVTLIPGTNRFVAKSVDTAGHESLLASNRFIFIPSSPLTLIIGTGGRVSGATNGQLLALGTNYTLTAMASNSFVFSNWTGGVISYTNVLRFVMTSNLILQANFVPNPFPAVVGNYNGLFYVTNDVQHGSSGFFTAAVQPSGTFSGSLKNGQNKFSFTGAFNLEGKATNQVARRGMNALTVELCLDLHGENQIIGKVSDGNWTAQLMADRAGFSRTDPATPFTNDYTLLIPGGTNAAVEPAGDGFGTVVVKPDGTLTFKGTLADGSPPVTQRVPLSKRGEWPLYLSLYGGKGSLLGWLGLLPSEEEAIGGRLNWFRPPTPKPKVHTNGFVLESMVRGSIFLRIGTNRVFDVDTAQVVFANGNLLSAFTNPVALGPDGRVNDRGSNRLTLIVKSDSGLFSGKVTPPGSAKSFPFKGVLLQRPGCGGGFFLGADQSGHVYFGP